MLVVLLLLLLAQAANLIGIFVLMGVLPRQGHSDWKLEDDVYRRLLLLFLFLVVLRVLGFAWAISLVWKLRGAPASSGHSTPSEHNRVQINDSDIQSEPFRGRRADSQ